MQHKSLKFLNIRHPLAASPRGAQIRRQKVPATLLLSAVLGLMLPNLALSEQEATEEITVTGTSIKGTPIDSAYALTSMNRSSLEDRGFPVLNDLFKSIGASHGVVGDVNSYFNSGQANTIGTSVGNVNLRGLGASRTLVLLNGRRQVYLPARLIGGRFVDTNHIPTTAIKQVDILKEGAAAIYGSDAVSGVVNFVTRDDFEGFDLSASHDAISGAGNTILGGIWGGSLGEAHAVLSAEYEHRTQLSMEERGHLLMPWEGGDQRGGWSSVGNPGVFYPTDSMGARKPGVIIQDPLCEEFGGYQEPWTCRFRYQPFDNVIPDTRYTRLFGELNGDWGDSGTWHLEALWARSEVPKYLTSPTFPPFVLLSSNVMEVGADHPGRLAFCADYPDVADCAEAHPWYFRGRPVGNQGTGTTAEREMRTWRLAGSLDGIFELGDSEYQYDLGLNYSHSRGNINSPGVYTERLFLAYRGFGGPDCGVGVTADYGLAAKMRVDNPMGLRPGEGNCEYYNPFSNSSQFSAQPGAEFRNNANPTFRPELANSPEMLNWLNSGLANLESEADLLVFDFTLSEEWIPGIASYALGYQWRRFEARATPNTEGNIEVHPCPVRFDRSCIPGEDGYQEGFQKDQIGPYIFSSLYAGYDVHHTANRAYGEVAFSWGEDWDIQLAANYEDYKENSSFDPRLAVLWRATDALTLRGSVQTTFRTPSVDDINENPLTTLEWVAPTGGYIAVDRIGSSGLEPEEALTYNFGLIVETEDGHNITVDYWKYEFDDVIASAPYASIAGIYASRDAAVRNSVAEYVVCPGGRGSDIVARGEEPCAAVDMTRMVVPLVNWPGLETSGVDFRWTGAFDIEPGTLNATLDFTYTIDYDVKAFSLNGIEMEPARDGAGRLNFGHPLAVALPEWKGSLGLSYGWGNYILSNHFNYISSYDEPGGQYAPHIESHITWDATFMWRMPEQDIALVLSLLNVTDERPPRINLESGYDGLTHDPKGRRFKLGMTWSF